MRYEGKLYRPPSEANSYIVQATIGCSHNLCTYCDMYRDKSFRERDLGEVLEDIEVAGSTYPGVEKVFDTKVFEDNVWGLEWFDGTVNANGYFPRYFKHVGDERVTVSAAEVPAETQLLKAEFKLAGRGQPYTSPAGGAWGNPGPARGPYKVDLTDGSTVTYSWYRFVDQPSFQQYEWSDAKKAKLQSFVEKIHAHWTIDRDYMAPPSSGKLAKFDPALLVTPPEGMEVGYVPIVTHQENTE